MCLYDKRRLNTKEKSFYIETFPFMFSECLGFPAIQHGSNLISLSEELFMDIDGKYQQFSKLYLYN